MLLLIQRRCIMDTQIISLYVGMAVAIFGGITGFLSTLLPLWRSRTNLLIKVPTKGKVYLEESQYQSFDEQFLGVASEIQFDKVLSADIAIVNMSDRDLAVYSVNLIDHTDTIRSIETNVDGSNFHQQPLYVSKPYCYLPIKIEKNNAALVSIKFKISNDDLQSPPISPFIIEVHCQGKIFKSEVLYDDISDYKNYI